MMLGVDDEPRAQEYCLQMTAMTTMITTDKIA